MTFGLGTVLTGVDAGRQQWDEDVPRKDLNGGEKATRAVVRGGATAGGAALGSFLGGAAGAACGPVAPVCIVAGASIGGFVGELGAGAVEWSGDQPAATMPNKPNTVGP